MSTQQNVKASLLLALLFISNGLGAEPTVSTKISEGIHSWPPPHMKDLPADYIGRLRQCLKASTKQINELNLNSEKGNKPVSWVIAGVPSFILGLRADEINSYFESNRLKYDGNPKFGFSLFASHYLRLYGTFNHRTGTMKGLLSPAAEKNFEKALWACAKANSKLAEAQRDVWDMEGSENHHMSSKVSDFLVAQYLRTIPEYANQKYDDGSTLQQQYEARLAYWSKWIDEHAKHGLFIEDGSSYQNHTVGAFFNLCDFAEDPILQKKAEMFLDLIFANIAEETLGTQRGGPKSRTKDEGFGDRVYDTLFNSPGSQFTPLLNNTLVTSSYYPSPAIVKLAKDTTGRGMYSYIKRAPGAVAPGTTEGEKSLWRTMDKNNMMVRNGFATSHYNMGSHGLNTAAKADPYRVQRWQGIVFANDPMVRIGMDGKNGVTKGEYISNPFKTIQDHNVMVTMKWAPDGSPKGVDPYLWIYFSALLDAMEEEDGWIFVKSGGAFAAVKVVGGSYKWQGAWKHSDTFKVNEKSFISLNSDAPIIMVANDASDYNNDFAAFKAALKAQPISYTNGVLQFATITHEGALSPGKINDKPVDLTPSLVNDSAFIRSKSGSGVIYIRKGNDTEILDFSDPKNPVRTIGVPVTDAFPKGVGDTKPIIFSTK